MGQRVWTITRADVSAKGAVTTGSWTLLDDIPAGSIVEIVQIVVATPFAGTAWSTCTAQIGVTGALTNLLGAGTMMAAGVLGDGISERGAGLSTGSASLGYYSNSAATDVVLTIISSGGNLSACSAGSMKVLVRWYSLE
jgi:hypothetical protein